MKKIINKFKLLFLSGILLITSCDTESFLGDNVDPNNPTRDVIETEPDLILAPAMRMTAISQERDRGQNHLGNMFMYNWSQSDGFSWYNDEFLYATTSSFYNQNFDYPYVNQLKQLSVLRAYEAPTYSNYKAIAKILMSYQFQILVDTYGDIPYFDALKRGANPFPQYDDAQEIYDDLIVELNSAINIINSASSDALVPGNDDGLFNGDMSMWKKFANSIKLRILVRQSDVSGKAQFITDELAKTVADGFMTTDVTLQVGDGYGQVDDQQNPKWDGFGADVNGTPTNTNQATCATPFILNYLTNTNDGRLDFIYERPVTGHLGVDQGILDYDVPVVDQFDPIFVSNIGPGVLKGPDQGAILMTLAEIYLNQAEAIHKGLLAGDAKTAYEMGIQASFSYLGAGDASSYYNQNVNLVGWDASANKVEAIITQKWIAVNGIDAIQSWFDYTRTGYPSGLPISLQATSSDRPVRLAYTSRELTVNSSNVPPQPNTFTAKIFWAN